MGAKERQNLEKSKLTFILGCIIIGVIDLLTLLGFVDVEADKPLVVVRTVINVIPTLFFIIGYVRNRREEKFVTISVVCMLVVYSVTIFTNQNVEYYAFGFLIMLAVVLVMDVKLTTGVCLYLAGANVIAGIKNYLYYADNASINQIVFMQMVYMLLFCIICHMTVKIMAKHTKEDTAIIQEQMDTAARMTAEIMALSKQLADEFDGARGKAEVLTDSIHTSDASVQEIASGVRRMAEEIDKQTMQSHDIQTNLENAEHNTKAIREAAEVSQMAIGEGAALIAELKKQAIQTAEVNRATRQTTEELNERIKEVEVIIGTILNISSQTNLLALNASIEAARAGEAGKGFAVVADEIRKLSEETKESTEQITGIIEKLTRNVEEASDNMQKSAQSAEKQNDMVEDTRAKFELIEEKINVLNGAMMKLTNEVDNIVDANFKMNDNILSLSANSEEVAASAETSLSVSRTSVQDLAELNGLLQQVFVISQQLEALAQQETK